MSTFPDPAHLYQWELLFVRVKTLRQAGEPAVLARAVEALKACLWVEGREEAIGALRRLEEEACGHLEALERAGFVFDFESGTIRVRSDGKAGSPGKIRSRLIGAAHRELDPVKSYTKPTYDAVRGMLAMVMAPDEIAELSDSTIRGAIQRYGFAGAEER